MEHAITRSNLLRGVVVFALSVGTSASSFAQGPSVSSRPEANQAQELQAKLQQVLNDKAGYAASIVQRWESDARQSGRWDESFTASLSQALTGLQPANLLAAGEASSFEEMMNVLATGRGFAPTGLANKLGARAAISPLSLGEATRDLVYTPVTPCRIADTRIAGGPIDPNSSRLFDVDANAAPWFTTQGGVNGSCGIPFGVARAVAMTCSNATWWWGIPDRLGCIHFTAAGQRTQL